MENKENNIQQPTSKDAKERIYENQRQIGNYRIDKTMGQGTFGKVKQGIHVYTNQKVAIKILEKKKIKDVSDVERVQREIHILKIVRHPNIIQLYEIIETQSKLYLIMEHCSNGELFDYITSKNRLKEEESCRLFQQLISGIEYLGELGIAHRDIKPENLLLDDFKNLKIVDFGLSNTFRAGEKLQTACGSPCYAAPELIRGKEYIGPKADLWSAGVVLYAEVCGYLPFEDQNTQSLYQKILKADFALPQFLSKESKDLIIHVLVPDPDLRYGIKQIKQHKWFKIYKPPQEISKGIRVGIDEQQIFFKLLQEMKEKNGVNEKYVKQCIEANRHNSSTAHYYLLLKQKLLDGEELEFDSIVQQEQQRQLNNVITASSQIRINKSMAAPRTTKYANYKQLRKIAEGLGDLNIVRIQQFSLENSMERKEIQQTQSKSPKPKTKTLQIKAPTLQDPDLPKYGDYEQTNNSSMLRHKDVNRSLEQKTPTQPLVNTILNESQTISSFMNHKQMQDNLTNRIRIKTRFKMTPSHNKSLTHSLYGTQNNTARFKNLQLNRFKRMDSINKSNILRIESNNLFPTEPNLGVNIIGMQSIDTIITNKARKMSMTQKKINESMNIQENFAKQSYQQRTINERANANQSISIKDQGTLEYLENDTMIQLQQQNSLIKAKLLNKKAPSRSILNKTEIQYNKQTGSTPISQYQRSGNFKRKTPSINMSHQVYLTNNVATTRSNNRTSTTNRNHQGSAFEQYASMLKNNNESTRSQSYTKKARAQTNRAKQEAIGLYIQENSSLPLYKNYNLIQNNKMQQNQIQRKFASNMKTMGI